MAMRRLGQTDAILFGFMVVYGLTNLILVYWAARGYLGPSIPLLEGLTLCVPVVAMILVTIIHYCKEGGMFHPLAVIVFILAMTLAFFLNGWALFSAIAAA